MVKVKVNKKQNQITSIIISGHANYAQHGEDLVCAGVSSIAIGACNALDLLVHDCCLFEIDNGFIKIEVVDNNSQVQLLLESIIIQLSTMERSYKKFIRINKQEV